MGCGSSTGSDGKIQMQKTKLAGMDEFFDDVQGFCDEVYEVIDPINDAADELMDTTDLDKVEGATVHHAMVGIVFALAAQSNGADVGNLFDVKPSPPFIEINKGSATGKTVKAIDDLMEYIKALTAAKDRIQPLAEKAKSFAEKAPDLPDKAKDELGNAGDLGAMDKIRAVKNTGANCKNMAKLPSLITDLKDTVTAALEDVQGGSKELNAKKGKLSDIGKECNSKGKATAKDCYLLCGDPIKATDAQKKKHKESQKRKQKKNAPAKK